MRLPHPFKATHSSTPVPVREEWHRLAHTRQVIIRLTCSHPDRHQMPITQLETRAIPTQSVQATMEAVHPSMVNKGL